MNFNTKQNEFCDIPGFDASRGERILKALQKLWKKIQYLQQMKTSEKKHGSEAQHSSNEEDLTLTDVQYKLLVLQLQYVRSLLKKETDPNSKVFNYKIIENEHNLPTSDGNITREDELHLDTINKPAPSDIQTTDNFDYLLNSTRKLGSTEDESKNAQITSDNQFPRFQHSTEDSTAVHQKIPSSSKPHYHLKLDDVPFILGASSTASHSVVANVQNIIAMMKSHNKALCGPKPNFPRSAVANFTNSAHSSDFTEKNPAGENSQDVTKMINDLTRDLCALNARQQKLAESYDATQRKKLGHEVNSDRTIKNPENKIGYKHAENGSSRKHRSNSESDVKLHAEVKKMPKIKEKGVIKPCAIPKPNANNVTSQPSNLSIMDRRKLLRSLQNFKKHLSEEDISWD